MKKLLTEWRKYLTEARFENEATRMVRDAVKNIKNHLRAYDGETRIKPRFGSIENPLESIVYDKKYFGGLPDKLADQGIVKVTFSMKVLPSTAFGEGKKFAVDGKTIRYDDDDPRSGETIRERQVVVNVDLSDEFRITDMSKLIEKMKDTTVHELIHGGQSSDVLKKSGIAQMKAFQHGLTSIDALRLYYLDPAETEAYARGIYKRAKMSKVPLTTKLDEIIVNLISFYAHPKTLAKSDTEYTEEGVNDFFKNEYRQSIISYAEQNLPAAIIEWQKYLKEAEAKYSGILKVKLNPDLVQQIQGLQEEIGDPNAISLPEKALHVTLVHQSILKPHRKQIKKMELPDAPEPIIDFGKGVQVKTDEGKMSWAVELENQDEMRDYVRQVMELLGEKNTDPEPERVFHISLANLTGNPQDSVR